VPTTASFNSIEPFALLRSAQLFYLSLEQVMKRIKVKILG